MDDVEQESINEELIEFAIRESVQDAYKVLRSTQINRCGPLRKCQNALSGVNNFVKKCLISL